MSSRQQSELISAEAILHSQSGKSLTNGDSVVTSSNVADFTPAHDTVLASEQLLRSLGFQVLRSGIGLTLVGRADQFEKVFRTKLRISRDSSTGGMTVRPDRPLIIPKALKGLVEAIVFPEPPEFFQ